MYFVRGSATCGRSTIIRGMVLPSIGNTLSFSASVYHITCVRWLLPVLLGEVVVLGRVFGDVVQLPVMGVQVGQRLGGDFRAEWLIGLRE